MQDGMEADVVAFWGESTVQPWILVIGRAWPGSREQNHHNWDGEITALGYEFVYFDGSNRFYASRSKPELTGAFAPEPNVFDEFLLSVNTAFLRTSSLCPPSDGHSDAEPEMRRLRNVAVLLEGQLARSDNRLAVSSTEIAAKDKRIWQLPSSLHAAKQELSLSRVRLVELSLSLQSDQAVDLVVIDRAYATFETDFHNASARLKRLALATAGISPQAHAGQDIAQDRRFRAWPTAPQTVDYHADRCRAAHTGAALPIRRKAFSRGIWARRACQQSQQLQSGSRSRADRKMARALVSEEGLSVASLDRRAVPANREQAAWNWPLRVGTDPRDRRLSSRRRGVDLLQCGNARRCDQRDDLRLSLYCAGKHSHVARRLPGRRSDCWLFVRIGN